MSRHRPRCTPKPPERRAAERGLESARRSSSLPSGVFRARSADVERALADGVGDVFLRHMARVRNQSGPAADAPRLPGGENPRNDVDARDRDALLAELRSDQEPASPALGDCIDAERAWVLVHLAFRGSDLARQAAAIELLQAAEEYDAANQAGADALQAFCACFDAEVGTGPLRSVLLHAVRRAACDALTTEAEE